MDLCLRILIPFWLSAAQCFPDGTTSPKRRPQIENENSGKIKQSKMKSNSRKEVRTEGSKKKEKPNLCEEIVNQSTELSCNRLAVIQCRICLKHLCYFHSNLRNRPIPLCRIRERNLWEELQELENMRVDDGSAFQLPVPSSHFEDGFQCSSMPNWLKMGYLLAKCLDFQVGCCRRDANLRYVDLQTLLCSRHVVTIDEDEVSVEICRQCLWQRTGRPFVNDDPIEEHKLQLDSDTRDSQRMCEVCHETAVHSCDMCTKPICSDHTAIIVELINETVWHLCYDCWRRGTSIQLSNYLFVNTSGKDASKYVITRRSLPNQSMSLFFSCIPCLNSAGLLVRVCGSFRTLSLSMRLSGLVRKWTQKYKQKHSCI